MKINTKFDKFLTSSTLSTAIFATSGIYKTYKDYQNADEKYKNRFLLKDTVVLAGASVGVLAHNNVSKKVPKIIMKNKLAQEVIRDVISGFSLFTSGIVGALSMDYLLEKTGFDEPEIEQQKEERKNVVPKKLEKNLDKFIDEETRNIMYSRVTDMPQMRILANSMIGSQAIDLSKDKEFDVRLKHTTKCLINNSLLPLLFLSLSSALTKGLKTMYRIPIIFASLVGGTMIANRVQESNIKQKILEETKTLKSIPNNFNFRLNLDDKFSSIRNEFNNK